MNQVFLRKVLKKLPKGMQKKARLVANRYFDEVLRENGTIRIRDLVKSREESRTSRLEPVKITDPSQKTITVLKKSECCGCSSCVNICPVEAVSMEWDEEGFWYPKVDEDRCINCGKCQKHCPAIQVKYVNNSDPECYAMMAEDEVRSQSSSGGMFTLLADYVFDKGGYVCGAAYGENFSVEHILVKTREELPKLRYSKYVQSDTKHVYQEVQDALKQEIPVLFSGCPCQIAGLNAFLGKEYENLYTVDLICHGVPSPKTFEKYLKDNYQGKPIREINFRDKRSFGWSTHMNIYFEDGSTHLERCGIDSYYKAFLPCLGMRPSCAECKYTALPRQADISIGDFWGIGKYKPELADNKGTSLVLVNSSKGQKVFGEVREKMQKVERMNVDDARPRNYTIDHPFKPHPNRERFFRLMKQYPFDKAVEYAIKRKFDIGVIGLWYGRNYGSMITYYALHKELTSMGLSVLMINNPLAGPNEVLTKTHPRRFAEEFYDISRVYSLGNLRKLNEFCDTFLVGSDQLWNYGLSRMYSQYYFLSFTDDNKKKIAYGTSFGKQQYIAPEGYRVLSAQNMKRFDAVSVREPFAIDMCRDIYGVDATLVTDPVFFCKDSDYARIEKKRPECEGDYILAYILDPYKEKTEALLHTAKRLNMKVKVILDETPTRFEENKKNMGIPEGAPMEILEEVDLKEWLYCFHHSRYVITDSFHGTCFAIIFKKNFTAMANPRRGSLRFTSLLEGFDLTSRLTPDALSVIDHPMFDTEIDYSRTEKLIDEKVAASREWLRKALFSEKKIKSYTAYPVSDERK